MPRLSLRPDEVAGDERLAVAGRQRVHGAPERGDQQREQHDAEREVAALDQRLEPAVGVLGATVVPIAGAGAPAAPGGSSTVARPNVERGAQKILRVGTQLVRAARRGRRARRREWRRRAR